MRHEAVRADPISCPLQDAPLSSLERAGPISIFQRSLDHVIAEAIDELPAALLPSIRIDGDLAAIDRALRSALTDLRQWQSWLEAWLREDIAFLARLFTELTGAASLAVRLEPVSDDACSRFHADNMTHRLVTTYRGPGTEWVSPRDAHLVQDGILTEVSARRQLERGWVGVLRGAKRASPDAPALLHRSPPLRKPDEIRLFLAIDDARDWPGGQPGAVGSSGNREMPHES